MIELAAAVSQRFAPAELPDAVRAALGKPLRRAPPLAQLAVLGALACLPPERRQLPTLLLWQTTSGPHEETRQLIAEIKESNGEPLPLTFLATVPASAAVHLRPFLPGLSAASMLPLDHEAASHWSLLLTLAANALNDGRYAQTLCAHLDYRDDHLDGHWLCLRAANDARALARLAPGNAGTAADELADTPTLPATVAAWLRHEAPRPLRLAARAAPGLAMEFVRA
jgi:hypothetical protein